MDYDPTVRDLNNRMKRQIYTPFGLLCHYTSLFGLKGSMFSKKLWFSDSTYSNGRTLL